MLRDLITSFWAQDSNRAELVIQDDASPDETPALMEAVTRLDNRIVYSRNDKNVGLTENTQRALRLARGGCIVILGDDDILLGPQALDKYVDAFTRYPDVHFVYPNQIQMDGHMNFDLAYRHFDHDSLFESGPASFENTWLKSVQTAGTALRRSEDLYKFYPRSAMLLPQVELVGRLLSFHASYGLADSLVGVRSHSDQLGFHANRRKRVVGPERHGTIEVLEIVSRLTSDKLRGPSLKYAATVMANTLATNLPNEKLKGGTRIAVSNALRLMRASPVARRNPRLLLSVGVTAAMPPKVLEWLRGSLKGAVRRRQRNEAAWFEAELCRQRESAADRWSQIKDMASRA